MVMELLPFSVLVITDQTKINIDNTQNSYLLYVNATEFVYQLGPQRY